MIFMAIAFILFGAFWLAVTVPQCQWHLAAFGVIFAAAGVFLAVMGIKDIILRKRYEKNPEEYEAMIEEEEKEWEEKHPEAVAYDREMEEIGEFDNDSGKGYCPFCGNYAVNSEKICGSCGEKVNE